MKRNLLVRSVLIPAFALSLMGATIPAAFPDPPADQQPQSGAKKATAVLAGGCFWGMQGVFEHVKGVTDTTVGYSGGEKKTAEYETVSGGKTGHAESIQIVYDPSVITFGQILKIYFSIAHDPTTLNRQHNDIGTQYRSEIFYADDDQKAVAEKYIQQLNDAHVFHSKIVTKVEPLKGFYAAEAHHQHYLDSHTDETYIQYFDLPMIAQLKKVYPDMYKK
jgi:peptide-methionine (S)-S-oxide reductase